MSRLVNAGFPPNAVVPNCSRENLLTFFLAGLPTDFLKSIRNTVPATQSKITPGSPQAKMRPLTSPYLLTDQLKNEVKRFAAEVTAFEKKPAFSEEVFTVSTSAAYENPIPPHYAKHESNHGELPPLIEAGSFL